MLDPKLFHDGIEEVKARLVGRSVDDAVLSAIGELSDLRRTLIGEVETLRSERNAVSKEIGQLKGQAKKDPEKAQEADKKMGAMRELGGKLKVLESELKSIEDKFRDQLLRVPNIADASVPVGKSEEENKEISSWGEIPQFSFKPKDHVTLGEELGIFDFERAGKISGARFGVSYGAAARLERALIQFMLDLHTREHGYTEVLPPFLVSRESMVGTGQLPKFEEDAFKTGTSEKELFLIPTAEVPLTNLYGDEILSADDLPQSFTAYTPCFRSEAGSYGRDTRGLIRQHQFQKVELVKFVHPDRSFEELENLVGHAEKVLQLLELPYRKMLLCSGDMGFGATKCYDLEVWLPGQQKFREISSCSNFVDFQARRAHIRFRPEAGAKPEFVHTLNGSGLAVGRTLVALMENYQREDGSIQVPKALCPYLKGAPGFEDVDGGMVVSAPRKDPQR